jgi:hypothetical protein
MKRFRPDVGSTFGRADMSTSSKSEFSSIKRSQTSECEFQKIAEMASMLPSEVA